MTLVALERAAVAWARRLALVGGGLLVAVAAATVADALLRYLWSRPLPGAFEATELVLAAIIFLGLPYTNLTDGHVSVDLVTARLGRRARHVLIAVNALVLAVLLGLITLQMGLLAAEHLATSRTTLTARIPVFPFSGVVTAVSGLGTLAFLLQSIGAAARTVRPALPPLAAPDA